MAGELIVMARAFSQPIVGDKMQIQGSHTRTGLDNQLTSGTPFVQPEGARYVQLKARVNLWYRLSKAGSAATKGLDCFMFAGETEERDLEPGHMVMFVLD